MISKTLALIFIGAVAGRVFLRPQLKELGRWFSHFVDVALVVIAVVYGVQLVMMLSRTW
ncbi:MAG: hypothetical protein AAF799_13620 [Myxococcota bacterium]